MNLLSQQYGPVSVLIARLFPGQVEVVLHDLLTGKIAGIEGSLSNRVAGDESLIDTKGLEADVDACDIIGPYAQTNWDGEVLRSFTAVVRDSESRPIGLICVNMRTAAFSAAADLIASLSVIGQAPHSKALFAQDWRAAANTVIAQTLAERGVTLVTAKRDDKVALIRALERAGVLQMRGSPEYAAKTLGISRASLYNLLKDARRKKDPMGFKDSVEAV
ncbi:transcriptional regulator [Pelagibius sp. Alg239-R121]|uniref:helix-turn-helix transcriptional regulator n=1 Tax=Pelagibius sp. Alg239-R121 TaxID=2993448 RepID=UPI0024A6208B|nr:PAS domain-containing protein [Pelagibius sp. Alg239-R121]